MLDRATVVDVGNVTDVSGLKVSTLLGNPDVVSDGLTGMEGELRNCDETEGKVADCELMIDPVASPDIVDTVGVDNVSSGLINSDRLLLGTFGEVDVSSLLNATCMEVEGWGGLKVDAPEVVLVIETASVDDETMTVGVRGMMVIPGCDDIVFAPLVYAGRLEIEMTVLEVLRSLVGLGGPVASTTGEVSSITSVVGAGPGGELEVESLMGNETTMLGVAIDWSLAGFDRGDTIGTLEVLRSFVGSGGIDVSSLAAVEALERDTNVLVLRSLAGTEDEVV